MAIGWRGKQHDRMKCLMGEKLRVRKEGKSKTYHDKIHYIVVNLQLFEGS